MKNVRAISLFTVILVVGCANSGPGEVVGTGAGAVSGYAVSNALRAGTAGHAVGAVVGALIGQAIGQSVDNQNSYRSSGFVREDFHPSEYQQCSRFNTSYERHYCEKGVHQRLIEQRHRREDDAYRFGLGR